ncbi:MAG: protein kinase, partial [Rhodothermales bacterium]|nr:protein kinase [Rhodothermales bacterium]
EGLKAAHDKEIVHRDMKAGNVMLTSTGVPKILDFGLAKTSASTKLTQMGSTLGTVAYMSPEQARGEEVDRRSDIWSLGAVIYEMVSGRMPFAGDYEQAVVYGILNADPEPLTGLRTGVPMELERIVNKCLAKDRTLRYQHVDDLAADLRAIETPTVSRVTQSAVTSIHEAPVTTPSGGSVSVRTVLVGAALLLFGLAAGWVLSSWTSPPSTSTPLHVSIPVTPEAGWLNYEPGSRQMALSADGTRLIYIGALPSGMETLFIVDLTSPGDAERLTHIELASIMDPVLSPDGESVAFSSFDGIRMASIRGGTVKELAETTSFGGGVSWSSEDDVIYSLGGLSGLYRVSVRSGEVEPLTTLDSLGGETGHYRGVLLPDGKTVACMIWGENQRLALIDTRTGNRYTVSEDGIYPQFVEPDILLYAEGRSLFAVQVDLSDYTLGQPRLVLDDVAARQSWGTSQFALDENGSLVYLTGGNTLDRRLVRIDADGTVEEISDRGLGIDYLTVSPTGAQIALTIADAKGSLVVSVYDTSSGDLQTVTPDGGSSPVWTSDGTELFFTSDRTGGTGILLLRLDGSSGPELILDSGFYDLPTSISDDGKYLVFERDTQGAAGVDIWVLPVDGTQPAFPLAQGPHEEMTPAISPDGRLVAYSSDVSGRREVYVTRRDGSGGRVKVSRSGETGGKLVWSADGGQLFFVSDGKLMRSTVLDGGTRFSDPEMILEADELRGSWIRGNWDLDRRSQGVVTLTQLEPSELRMIVNWKAELDRLLSGE